MNCLHLNRCQPLTGDDYALLRQNPDRGFRLEAYLRLGSGSAVFHPGFLAGAYLEKQLVFYREEDCKLVQLYVYLSEYLDRPLDAHAFSQLEKHCARSACGPYCASPMRRKPTEKTAP